MPTVNDDAAQIWCSKCSLLSPRLCTRTSLVIAWKGPVRPTGMRTMAKRAFSHTLSR